MINITVLNKYKMHKGTAGIYIGRGSPLGNPFVIGKHGTRKEVIEAYRGYLKENIDNDTPSIINALNDLAEAASTDEGVNLICFCKPVSCHGDVIKEFIEEALKEK